MHTHLTAEAPETQVARSARSGSAPDAVRPHGRLPPTHVAALLLLPAAITLLLPNWYYSDPTAIDAWFYTGFFRYLDSFAATVFPDTYYGTRLGWIVPGRIVYAVFGAVTGTFILHTAFYTVAIASMYGALRETAHPSLALFGALAFGSYLPAIAALGDDYVAVAVVTYALLAMYLAMRAHRLSSPGYALGAGFFGAAMIHSNIAAILLVPSAAVWMLPWPVARHTVKRAAWLFLWWALGAIICTVVLGEISAYHGGRRLFFMPSINWLLHNSSTNPWDVPGAAWVLSRPWSLTPFACALAAAVAVLRAGARRRPIDGAQVRWLLAFGSAFASFAILEFVWHGAVLYYDYYASWLLPATFGALVAVVVRTAGPRLPLGVALGAAAALLVAAVWRESVTWVFGWASGAVLVLAALASAGLAHRAMLSAALVTAGLVFVNAWLAPSTPPAVDRAEAFRVVDQAVRHVDARMNGRQAPRFVTTAKAPLGAFFNATAAVYLWGYSIVTWDYPTFTATNAASVPPGTLITIMSDQDGELQRFNNVAAPHGLRGELIGVERIETSITPLYLTFLRTHSTANDAQPSPDPAG